MFLKGIAKLVTRSIKIKNGVNMKVFDKKKFYIGQIFFIGLTKFIVDL